MIYCRKCSRLLDEDSITCPYCGSIDENDFFEDTGKEIKIDSIGFENTGDKNSDISSGFSETDFKQLNINDKNDFREEIDNHVNDLDEIFKNNPIGNTSDELLYDDKHDTYKTYSEKTKSEPVDKTIDTGIKVLIFIISLIIPIVGIVISIIFMLDTSKNYKSFGYKLLIAMIIEILLIIICCCAFALLGAAEYA